MMSIMRRDVLRIRGYAIEKPSDYPSLRNSLTHKITTRVDEDDELFIGYGLMPNPMPFTMQDNYALEESELEFPSIVLENEFLEAVFLPTLGGRLWSLYDKKAKRDLVTRNPVFKPGNFAIRNAWVAGGIEWNIGRRGHDARTSSPLFAARLALPDGTPVLRLYEFCRDRAATYQMEFFLPDGEKFLFARMRIVNPNEYTVPMYHFSNTAVTECADMRIVTPAYTTFANAYVNDSDVLKYGLNVNAYETEDALLEALDSKELEDDELNGWRELYINDPDVLKYGLDPNDYETEDDLCDAIDARSDEED